MAQVSDKFGLNVGACESVNDKIKRESSNGLKREYYSRVEIDCSN